MNVVNPEAQRKLRLAIRAEVHNNTSEMSRLINAALVDKQFCRLLLTNPSAALDQGCYGETFDLPQKERQFILSTRATSLFEFAKCWVSFSNPYP
jgi:hypothetical protein